MVLGPWPVVRNLLSQTASALYTPRSAGFRTPGILINTCLLGKDLLAVTWVDLLQASSFSSGHD